MAYRGKMSRGHSKASFRGGSGRHPKNNVPTHRGGYRM